MTQPTHECDESVKRSYRIARWYNDNYRDSVDVEGTWYMSDLSHDNLFDIRITYCPFCGEKLT